jgi:hypothetical protein
MYLKGLFLILGMSPERISTSCRCFISLIYTRRIFMTTRLTPFVCRSGENLTRQYPRCGRFFHNESLWFFKTREGVDYGPYENQTECKYAYEEFIDVVSDQEPLGGIAIDFGDSDSKWKVPNIDFN